MCKRGDGESCRANERVRKVGDGAGKGRGERVLVLRFQVIPPRGGHNRAEPKDCDCWGYKNSQYLSDSQKKEEVVLSKQLLGVICVCACMCVPLHTCTC